jgi:hypothetical protein
MDREPLVPTLQVGMALGLLGLRRLPGAESVCPWLKAFLILMTERYQSRLDRGLTRVVAGLLEHPVNPGQPSQDDQHAHE